MNKINLFSFFSITFFFFSASFPIYGMEEDHQRHSTNSKRTLIKEDRDDIQISVLSSQPSEESSLLSSLNSEIDPERLIRTIDRHITAFASKRNEEGYFPTSAGTTYDCIRAQGFRSDGGEASWDSTALFLKNLDECFFKPLSRKKRFIQGGASLIGGGAPTAISGILLGTIDTLLDKATQKLETPIETWIYITGTLASMDLNFQQAGYIYNSLSGQHRFSAAKSNEDSPEGSSPHVFFKSIGHRIFIFSSGVGAGLNGLIPTMLFLSLELPFKQYFLLSPYDFVPFIWEFYTLNYYKIGTSTIKKSYQYYNYQTEGSKIQRKALKKRVQDFLDLINSDTPEATAISEIVYDTIQKKLKKQSTTQNTEPLDMLNEGDSRSKKEISAFSLFFLTTVSRTKVNNGKNAGQESIEDRYRNLVNKWAFKDSLDGINSFQKKYNTLKEELKDKYKNSSQDSIEYIQFLEALERKDFNALWNKITEDFLKELASYYMPQEQEEIIVVEGKKSTIEKLILKHKLQEVEKLDDSIIKNLIIKYKYTCLIDKLARQDSNALWNQKQTKAFFEELALHSEEMQQELEKLKELKEIIELERKLPAKISRLEEESTGLTKETAAAQGFKDDIESVRSTWVKDILNILSTGVACAAFYGRTKILRYTLQTIAQSWGVDELTAERGAYIAATLEVMFRTSMERALHERRFTGLTNIFSFKNLGDLKYLRKAAEGVSVITGALLALPNIVVGEKALASFPLIGQAALLIPSYILDFSLFSEIISLSLNDIITGGATLIKEDIPLKVRGRTVFTIKPLKKSHLNNWGRQIIEAIDDFTNETTDKIYTAIIGRIGGKED